MLEQLLSLDQRLTLLLNGSHSIYWDTFFMTVTSTVVWLPLVAVLLYVLIRNNATYNVFLVILFIGLSILFADQMASGICKPYFERFRPTHEPSIMYTVKVVNGYRGGLYGFFSSHAANTFAVAVFVSLLIRRLRLSIVLFIWAIQNTWSRVYLGVHYAGDLLVGVVWGSLVGSLMYFIMKKISKHKNAHLISSTYTATGYRVADADLLYAAFVLTFLYIFYRSLFVF